MTPRQVGNYRLDGLLGSGGMGEVYKAYDTQRGRYVALKLLPAALSRDPEYLRRFERESYVAARLTEPHVVPIHDFGEIDGQLFIDMRLVDGSDIHELLATRGRIAPDLAVYLIGQVAEALDAAHADNLVHRDIKPSNILVTRSDFVYVVDFGIARSVGGQQTALTITGATMGTLHYMAPERFVGHEVDGRADIYSLACVLHECLTGQPPFSGKDMAALMYAQLYLGPPAASGLVEGVPPALDAVIARGMAKDPDERFPTAGALAAAARAALPGGAPTQSPVPVMTELPAPPWAQISPPIRTDEPAPAATDVPVTTWQPAPAPTTWEPVATAWGTENIATAWGTENKEWTPDPVAEPPGYASALHSPTQSVPAVEPGGHWGGTQPPENLAQRPDPGLNVGYPPSPDVGYPPPGGPAAEQQLGQGRRRVGLLILLVVLLLAIPVGIVLALSGKSHTGGTAAATTSVPARTARTGSAKSAASSAPALAVPTAGGKIPVGQNPSFVQVAPNGQFAYVTNPGADSITVLNTANNLVSKTIPIPQGPPQFVSFSPDSKTAYVSVYKTNGSVHLIAFLDTATGAVTGTVPVNNFTPTDTVTSPDGKFLYVPNHNTAMSGTNQNVVDVIDLASRKLIGSVPVLPNPHWVVFGKDNGRFYTTDHMSATVTVVNAQTNAVISEIEVGETPHSEALSPDGSRLAVTSYDGNVVYLIDTATDKKIATIPVGREPLNIAYSPDGRYLLTVNSLSDTLSVINTADNQVIGTVRTGKAPTSISILPNGKQAYVTDDGDGTIEIVNFAR
jgi:YVTN family beta-propeller protein